MSYKNRLWDVFASCLVQCLWFFLIISSRSVFMMSMYSMSFITTHLFTVKLRNMHAVTWSVDPTRLSLLALSSFLVFVLLDQAIELCKDCSVCSQTPLYFI